MMKIDRFWIKERLADAPRGTQAKLAEHLGLTPDTVSKIMTGRREIQQDEMPRVLSFFNARIVTDADATADLTPLEAEILSALRDVPADRRPETAKVVLATVRLAIPDKPEEEASGAAEPPRES